MKRILTGIFLLILAFHSKAAIPFFPCDSVIVSSLNPNETMQRIEILMMNYSISTFNTPHMSGVLVANPYITIGSIPGQSAVLDYFGGPNGGITGFALNCTSFAAASAVPTGTVFTGTITLYNPNDLSASCDYPVSFTYGTGPVGIATFSTFEPLPAYPNPATDFILLGENTVSSNTNWLIYDCLGNLVMSSNSNRIDLSGLAAGTYFFRDEEKTGKFVKMD